MPPRSTKRTKVGDVLDNTFADLPDFQFFHQVSAIFFTLAFNERTTADDDISTGIVDLQNFGLDDAANEIADVAGATNIDLTSGQEYVDTNVDQQSTFDLSDDRTGDHLALADLSDDLFPLDDLFGFALAQRDHSIGVISGPKFVLHLFDQDFYRRADDWLFLFRAPFIEADGAFTLEADVDQGPFIVDFNDPAVDDFALGVVLLILFQPVQQPLVCFFFRGQNCQFVDDVVVVQAADKVAINHLFFQR